MNQQGDFYFLLSIIIYQIFHFYCSKQNLYQSLIKFIIYFSNLINSFSQTQYYNYYYQQIMNSSKTALLHRKNYKNLQYQMTQLLSQSKLQTRPPSPILVLHPQDIQRLNNYEKLVNSKRIKQKKVKYESQTNCESSKSIKLIDSCRKKISIKNKFYFDTASNSQSSNKLKKVISEKDFYLKFFSQIEQSKDIKNTSCFQNCQISYNKSKKTNKKRVINWTS